MGKMIWFAWLMELKRKPFKTHLCIRARFLLKTAKPQFPCTFVQKKKKKIWIMRSRITGLLPEPRVRAFHRDLSLSLLLLLLSLLSLIGTHSSKILCLVFYVLYVLFCVDLCRNWFYDFFYLILILWFDGLCAEWLEGRLKFVFSPNTILWLTELKVLIPNCRWWSSCSPSCVPAGSPSLGGNVAQPSLPTPIYSVLVSVPDFMALSTVFPAIHLPDNSPRFRSVLLVLFLP